MSSAGSKPGTPAREIDLPRSLAPSPTLFLRIPVVSEAEADVLGTEELGTLVVSVTSLEADVDVTADGWARLAKDSVVDVCMRDLKWSRAFLPPRILSCLSLSVAPILRDGFIPTDGFYWGWPYRWKVDFQFSYLSMLFWMIKRILKNIQKVENVDIVKLIIILE